MLIHSAKPSGAELALTRLLGGVDHEDVLVVSAEPGPVLDLLRRRGVRAVHLPGLPSAGEASRSSSLYARLCAVLVLLHYGTTVARHVADHPPEVVVARSVKSMVYGAVAARRLGVPLVWSVHDRMSADYLGRVSSAVVRVLGRLLPSAYVVNSTTTRDTISTGGKPVLVSPPPLDTTAASRVALGPVERVVMVGRLAPWKGQHLFLEAFARVFAGTDVEAVVVGSALFGEDDYAVALQEQAAGLRVRFTGQVDDVPAELRAAQVAVHASTLPEPFGAVVVEAMAAGCAVVATAPGGPAEVVTDGTDGLLVPCGDVEALVAALTRLRDDGLLRTRLSRAAPLTAARYRTEVVAPEWEDWLIGVAHGGTKGSTVTAATPTDDRDEAPAAEPSTG